MITNKKQQAPFNLQNDWVSDILILSACILLFYLLWLGSYPLFTPDEGRYSEVAREMIATRDFITPRVNGVAFLDKPILYYWLQAIAMMLFGVKEWALRIFPVLSGVLGCVMTYVCGRRLFNRRTGLLAAAILATTPLYFAGAHYANLDLEVAVFVSCSLLCIITAIHSQAKLRDYFLIAAYVFAALAVLTKGLIGIVFPCVITGIWLLVMQQLNLLKKMRILTGLGILLFLTLPWYVLVQRANPEFLHYFFVTQQVSRFLSNGDFNNKSPFWFYLPIILAGFLPWTIFVVQSLKQNIQAVWQARKTHGTELFLLLWFFTILIFFSVPRSKTIGYILPVFPALALLTGHYLSEKWEIVARIKQIVLICLSCSTLALLTIVASANHLNKTTAKPLVTQLKAQLTDNDEVINYFRFYHDVPLYLERRISIVANWNAPDIAQRDNWLRELWYGMPFQDTSKFLINEDEFWRRWESEKRVFVFVNENYFAQFKARADHYFVIGTQNEILLLSNQPNKVSGV